MKIVRIIRFVFALIGLVLLTGAAWLLVSTSSLMREGLTAEGTVVELARSSDSGTYRPVVRFATAGGTEHELKSTAGSNPPSYSVGEKVTVFYRPAEPNDAKIDGFFSLWGAALIVGVLGVLFFLAGLGMFIVPALQRRRAEYLRSHGVPIETDFQSVELNSSLEVNGRHPFRILTQWRNPATSEIHVFTSSNLWFDPTDYVTSKRITVFIERDNPKKYHVDISFLPKLVE